MTCPDKECNQPGICITTSGTCWYSPQPPETICSNGHGKCDGAGNCVLITDSCVSKPCALEQECTNEGVCDISTGQCSYKHKNSGTACTDGLCDGNGNCIVGMPVT